MARGINEIGGGVVKSGYKRGQAELALWRFFSAGFSQGAQPPEEFLIRVKRLLEVDWNRDTSKDSEVRHPRFAFRDGRGKGGGKGWEVSYTLFNVCCLGWGLELLDVGLKQSEVVFLLRHLCKEFQQEFEYILENPPAPGQRMAAEDRPSCPSYEDQGLVLADCRVYAIIQMVKFKELFPHLKGRKILRQPIFPTPVFCHGYAEAAKELHRMQRDPLQYRKAFVMEIAHMVILVKQYLEEAPAVPRGRK